MLKLVFALAKCLSLYVKVFLYDGKLLTGELCCLVIGLIAFLLNRGKLVKRKNLFSKEQILSF